MDRRVAAVGEQESVQRSDVEEDGQGGCGLTGRVHVGDEGTGVVTRRTAGHESGRQSVHCQRQESLRRYRQRQRRLDHQRRVARLDERKAF